MSLCWEERGWGRRVGERQEWILRGQGSWDFSWLVIFFIYTANERIQCLTLKIILCSSSPYELVLCLKLIKEKDNLKASDENEARSKILSAESRNGISLRLPQCMFVGVYNGVFNLIFSEKDACPLSPFSLTSNLPNASWNCWLIAAQWQQYQRY